MLRDNVLEEVDRINGAYTETLDNHGVEIIHERATSPARNEITLAERPQGDRQDDPDRDRRARRIVPTCPGHEHGITSNEAFHLDAVPKRILIAGAGYIANEFAGIFHQFGAHVTLINRTDVILRGYDESIRDRLLQISHDEGDRFPLPRRLRGDREAERTACLTVSMSGHEPIDGRLRDVRDRPRAQHRGARAGKRRASSSTRRARSWSTPTTAVDLPTASTRSATSPTASS